MEQLKLYDNGEIAKKDTGWAINSECPLIIESTRAHSLKEYGEQFAQLQTVDGAVQFWMGDVANAGKKEHGKGAMQEIAEALDINLKTLWNNAYVAKHCTSSREEVYPLCPSLTHNHYRVVAALDDSEQIEWLLIAGDEGLSAAQLRKRIKGDEWEPRYFNHWSALPIEDWQQTYPGQIPGGILQNVLHYTTQRGDLVIDPFGGGGNMALACERMGRDCITYDIDPKYPKITNHNAAFPFPDGDAQLVFLDPPYWGQKKGSYAPDPADLSNVDDPKQFHALLKAVVDNAREALASAGYCVLIIGASQTKDYYIDHAAEMYALLKDEWKHENSVAAAYPTTQYSGNDMNNAKRLGYMLNLYTTIQIWKRP